MAVVWQYGLEITKLFNGRKGQQDQLAGKTQLLKLKKQYLIILIPGNYSFSPDLVNRQTKKQCLLIVNRVLF